MKRVIYIVAALFFISSAFGQYDKTFNTSGWVHTSITNDFQIISELKVQADQKILVSGSYLDNKQESQPMLIRYNTDGTRDNGFGNNGLLQLDFFAVGSQSPALALATDGRIYLASSQEHADGPFMVYCFKHDGSFETSFGTSGVVLDSINAAAGIEHVVVMETQADGKLLVGGYFVNTNEDRGAWLKRYNTDGTVDESFGAKGLVKVLGDGYTVRRIFVMDDGRILCGGKTKSTQQKKEDFLLFRLNDKGAYDSSFGGAGIKIIGMQDIEMVTGMGLQSDGKIVFGGPCGNGYTVFRVLRINPDGSGDPNFGTEKTSTGNFGFIELDFLKYSNHYMADLAILPNGQIMFAGTWSENMFTVVKLQKDGILDATFYVGGRLDSSFGQTSIFTSAATFDIQTGRFYVAGRTSFNGETSLYIAAVLTGQSSASLSKLSVAGSVYPNPVHDVLHVEFDSEISSLEVYDIHGKIVLGAFANNMLKTDTLMSGVYVLRIVSRDGNKLFKFIKE